jgi:hypothetical protein
MSNSIVPITTFDRSFTGVLPTGNIGKGVIHQKTVQVTVYPDGATVTRIYHNSIEVYDNRGIMTKHNLPNQIDMTV